MGAAACCDGPAACVADPLVAGAAPRCQWAFGTYRGMTLTPLSRYDLLSPGLDASIKRMKSLSVDTVALVFYHFQDNDTSTEIFLDYNRYSADPTALAAAVRLIHANGLKVLLKPRIPTQQPPGRPAPGTAHARPPAAAQARPSASVHVRAGRSKPPS
ncbi:hypothetical protein I4F81_012601 [Pyropia yezoensis]|uniref:Uncharacterized protein n=1 Tax=Pyropia yezoensis TaxID=2788 RepID=A0ACC3CIM4_PYRYE|nr:hypothetical protein I4F81_012601 [Neopyropia yezoensis]